MIKLDCQYRHHKSGKEVLVKSFSKTKVGRDWVSSVIYTEGIDTYVRSVFDFQCKFDIIE